MPLTGARTQDVTAGGGRPGETRIPNLKPSAKTCARPTCLSSASRVGFGACRPPPRGSCGQGSWWLRFRSRSAPKMPRNQTPPRAIIAAYDITSFETPQHTGFAIPPTPAKSYASTVSHRRLARKKQEHETLKKSMSRRKQQPSSRFADMQARKDAALQRQMDVDRAMAAAMQATEEHEELERARFSLGTTNELPSPCMQSGDVFFLTPFLSRGFRADGLARP